MPEVFWTLDPLILVHPKYLHRFFPSENLHMAARMNAIMRCSLYIAFALMVIRKEIVWGFIPIMMGGITASWMYREKPGLFQKQKTDPDLQYLVSAILDGHPMKQRNVSKSSSSVAMDTKVFKDTDENMQEMQLLRARQTDSVSGGIPDTPNFARKLLQMDNNSFLDR